MAKITIETKALEKSLNAGIKSVVEIPLGQLDSQDLRDHFATIHSQRKQIEGAWEEVMSYFKDLLKQKNKYMKDLETEEASAKAHGQFLIEELGEVIKGVSLRTTQKFSYNEDMIPETIEVDGKVIDLFKTEIKLDKKLAKKYMEYLPKGSVTAVESKSIAVNSAYVKVV